jgi:hypothetical protein
VSYQRSVWRNRGVKSSIRWGFSNGPAIGETAHTEQLAAVAGPESARDISSRHIADATALIPPPPYADGQAAHW